MADKGKKQIPLRLSEELYNAIAAWAEDDFRSVNGQIEFLLTECVKQRKKTEPLLLHLLNLSSKILRPSLIKVGCFYFLHYTYVILQILHTFYISFFLYFTFQS